MWLAEFQQPCTPDPHHLAHSLPLLGTSPLLALTPPALPLLLYLAVRSPHMCPLLFTPCKPHCQQTIMDMLECAKATGACARRAVQPLRCRLLPPPLARPSSRTACRCFCR